MPTCAELGSSDAWCPGDRLVAPAVNRHSNALAVLTKAAWGEDALDIGFIVFASREQGTDQWIKFLNLRRADQRFWILLYWEDPVHYRLPPK